MSEPELAIMVLLEMVLRERLSGLCLAVDLQPTLTVDGQLHVLDEAPVDSERMVALFQSIASPAQVQQLKDFGCEEFIYNFDRTKFGQPAFGRFRVEAKAVNGNVVSLKFHRLPVSDQPI